MLKASIANTDAASASDTHNDVFVPEHGNEHVRTVSASKKRSPSNKCEKQDVSGTGGATYTN